MTRRMLFQTLFAPFFTQGPVVKSRSLYLDERVAALEELTAGIVRGVSVDGLVPYIKFPGRIGVMSDYWCKQPQGQGAAVSVGTAVDRFGVYTEIDPRPDGFAPCPDRPSVAL